VTGPVNPYAPPKVDPDIAPHVGPCGTFVATIVGDDLIVTKEAPLPPVCVKCGTRDQIERRRQLFGWTPPWVFALIVINLLVAAIVQLIVRKKGYLSLPLCTACNARWRAARLVAVLSGLGIVFGLIAGLVLLIREPVAGLIMIVLALAAPVALLVTFCRVRLLRARKVDEQTITLIGVHDAAKLAIVEAARGQGGSTA
jgi:hypothetical protein